MPKEIKLESLNLTDLALKIQDPIATFIKVSLGARVVENLLIKADYKSKRCQADFQAAYKVCKGYELAGGKI